MENTKTCCHNCRFWAPTQVNDRFGADAPVVGRCEPTASDGRDPALPCWPAVAFGDDDAVLLTLSTFGCVAWQAKRGEA
jgi:hypothetical protein